MPAPRKVFRIEELSAARSEPPTNQHDTSRHGEILRELSTLRVMLALPFPAQTAESGIARQDDIRQLALQLRLILSAIRGTQQKQTASSGLSVPTTRLADELEAVAQDTELAVQKILAAAEHIDQAANSLAASLKGQFERGLTQDIRDCVIQIFEACNFQDLTSQRVAKVVATVARLERHVANALDALSGADAAPPVHGPRLPGDPGHVSQSDVDSMFVGDAQSA